MSIQVIKRKNHLTGMDIRLPAAINEQMSQVMQEMVEHAKGIAPVQRDRPDHPNDEPPGTLRDSIYAENVAEMKWVFGAAAPYAAFVELGTRFMSAQPFIMPTFDLYRRRFDTRMRRAAEIAAGI